MTDEDLLDGSSYDYKLTKDMLGTASSMNSDCFHSPRSKGNTSVHVDTSSPSQKSPRIPNFLNSPSPQVSFVLRQRQYGINTESGNGNNGGSNNNRSNGLSMNDLGSSIMEYKKEIEQYESKKRGELLSSQVSLLEVYRNKIASSLVAIEEIKQEYEQKLYQQKIDLSKQHEAEMAALREEESNRQFTDHIRIGALKDKIKLKYENKIKAFQQDVEATKTALYNKKLQVQGSVEFANREITTLRLQQESTARLHQDEIKQQEGVIGELQARIKTLQSSELQHEEMVRLGVEVAALVVHMHHKGRPLCADDMDAAELYKHLNQDRPARAGAEGGGGGKDTSSSQTIVSTAYLQKALLSSKKLIQSSNKQSAAS